VCFICGREYGTTSLKIHIPQCTKLWEEREAQKPPRERRPVPTAPAGLFDKGMPVKTKDIDKFNEAAFEGWKEEALMPCPNCGRKFLQDRLQVHLRSCRPGSTAKPVAMAAPNAAAAAAATISPERPAAGPAAGKGASSAAGANANANAKAAAVRAAGSAAVDMKAGGRAGGGKVLPPVDPNAVVNVDEIAVVCNGTASHNSRPFTGRPLT
jgi:hypothetical protein